MRVRGVLVLAVLAVAALPAATGSAGVMCGGQVATIVGTAGPDDLDGTPGPDVIAGQDGNDFINGYEGNDRICGGGGNDIIRAGAGNDRVWGGVGWDIILGDEGADVLRGGAGADVIHGGAGDDRLFGQAGADNLDGDAGIDTVTGGLGTDTCYGETKASCELPPPPLPWIVTAQGVGPISVGGPLANLNLLTGFAWTWQEPGAEGCLVGQTPSIDMYVQSDHGAVIDHITVYDPGAAVTAAGIGVGDTRGALNSAYAGHVVKVTDDGYSGVAVWVDLDNDGQADMIAVFDGTGTSEPITDIRLPAILTEGGCL